MMCFDLFLRPFLLIVNFLLIFTSLWGEPLPVPSSGIIEREIEKEYEAKPIEPEKKVPSFQIDIPEERLDLPSHIEVMVTEVRWIGNQSISSRALNARISPYLRRNLSIRSIYALCHEVDLFYAEEGYFLARAYPPPQEIKNGVLIIEVIEGRLGEMRVEGNRHYSSSFILSYFHSLKGSALREQSFLRRLMLLNENIKLVARAIFERGKRFGFADVILYVEDRRPVHLAFNGNNYGKNLTTNTRVGGKFDWGSLCFEGDSLSITEVVGFPLNALFFNNILYKVPLNRVGTFLEVAYLFSTFKVEEQVNLLPKGISQIATLKLSQALTRSRSLNLDLFSYFDYKQIRNFALHHLISYDKLRILSLGLFLDYARPLFSRDYVTVQFSGGIPDFLGGLSSVDCRSSRIGGGGRFFLWTVDYDRIQYLPKDCFLYFHGSGQLSPSRLTVPEQIYIGGMGSVRGFPLAVGVGDSGYYANLEFRTPVHILANKQFFWSKRKWKEVFQFDLFLDHGATALQSTQSLFLFGYGAGIRLNDLYGVSLSLDVGFPLNHRDLSKSAFFYLKLVGQPF